MSTEPNSSEMPVIEVCFGPECSDCGGREIAEELEALGMKVVVGDCRDQCPNAPMVLVDNRMIIDATVKKIQIRIGER
ncbi:MAG: (2Fe-2S) ferredoxin domain-containing protein [Mariprofundaceae bacterium]|nr:(2Fe-2S) ferredoxin domain-containing protein [Mariprofundaceae bacterium]